MPRQLNIRSDKAYDRARQLAAHYGVTTTRVIEDALDEYAARRMLPSAKITAEEAEAAFRDIRQMVADLKPFIKPGATSDHSDMYDENGLPI